MTADRSLRTMLAVTLLHLAALFSLLYPGDAALSQQPVLSFTVTLTDLSSSPNTVSSAASASSSPAAKLELEKNTQEARPETRPADKKETAKASAAPSPRTDAPLSHSSRQQTAVLAPVTPAQFDAAYLQNPPPAYPPLSRRMGEQGSVLLGVYVNERGQAEDLQLRKSSGFGRLDSAALEAVRRWRFVAARQGEQLIASWVQVPVKFVLE